MDKGDMVSKNILIFYNYYLESNNVNVVYLTSLG